MSNEQPVLSADARPEDILKALDQTTTKNGLLVLREQLEEVVSKYKQSVAVMQGQLVAYTSVLKLLDTLASRLHSVGVEATPAEVTEATGKIVEPIVESELQKETRRRIEEGKCTYRHSPRSGGPMAGKWCQRPIASELGTKHGYCDMCLEDLGIEE